MRFALLLLASLFTGRGATAWSWRWRDSASGFTAALEVLRNSRIAVNDVNSEYAEGYAIASFV